MPRLIRLDATSPIEIPPQKTSAWICACGLSRNPPHCDGSHKKCDKTEPDASKLYLYDADRKRVVDTQDA